MTDDHLERLKQKCEGKRDITLPALEVLNLVDMVQNYGAEIDRLHESLETYQKVVGLLRRTEALIGWILDDYVAVQNNLDIAALQKGMGK